MDPITIEEAALELEGRITLPPDVTPDDLTDDFGHWLAGFTDGEGAFVICRVTTRRGKAAGSSVRTWPNCRFEIGLRADDIEILRTIRDTLGVGNLYVKKPNFSARPGTKMAAVFIVHRIDDCLRIVEFFTRYPLRAKKRAQFDVWADAVHEMAKGRDRDDALMVEYQARLAELRQFVAPDSLEAAIAGNPATLKHRRNYGIAPACLCGCGGTTKILSNAAGIAHPENSNYSSYLRGHGRRVRLS